MTTGTVSTISEATPAPQPAVHASWFYMLIIALAQIQMGFNINSLTISMGAIVEDFNTSASSVGTALVVYSLFVASFVILGAKLGRRFGSRLAFQLGTVIFTLAMVIMTVSTNSTMMIAAQAVAGIGAAILVPALVVMIAVHYEGKQQSQALGYLQSAQALAGVLAFLIAGYLATAVGWRASFVLTIILALIVLGLSFRLKTAAAQPGVKIDWIGAALAAGAIILISLGFDNLNRWGLIVAKPNAPFDLLGMSPAPLMIILGIVLGQAFFMWSHSRARKKQTPLLALEVIDSRTERAAVIALLIIGGLGPAVNFLIPLYIQIVQGRTSLQTSVSIIPYTLAIFASAALAVRLFDRLTPRVIARTGFIVVAAGMAFLAAVIQNEWGTPFIITGLVIVGLGEGTLLTLMFNVMVRSAPKALAGDVGALRGTVNNLSTAVGTALAGALAIGVLSASVMSSLNEHPTLPPELFTQVDLDNVDFVTNDRLLEVLDATTANDEQVAAAVQLNEEARLQALKISFLFLASLSLLAIIPAGGLPGVKLDEMPREPDPADFLEAPKQPEPVPAPG
jgi:MFS family permease